ncbi:hypothetical protein EXIGLDRAFT_835124 [Exidia glandulosa HHB12029]|uniref:Hepatocellular carcinoma-associated antigen 59-domain-containing protein n=1 Tax=Exidia glandulosa HHB12029 TaxID=1314781 RepID=A0A165J2V3_EXIGL|nr:hypothetical protein EXIGLDRAFT_835124 [Exidia glandulosa HHB12029]
MIKKRSRPQTAARTREQDTEPEQAPAVAADADEEALDLNDLLELRRLKRSREGIDASKLRQGDVKKRKVDPATAATITPSGLREIRDTVDDELEGDEAKARRAVRANNFTQQTNTLDVDKHMMNYIEENMRKRHGRGLDEDEKKEEPWDPQAELYRIEPIFSTPAKPVPAKPAAPVVEAKKKPNEEGSVTNSTGMLTAIPEVDLGMDTRLRNIEDTEKAKRAAADARRDRLRVDKDDLVAGRFYRGQDRNKLKTDEELLHSAMAVELGHAPDPAKRQPHAGHSGNRKEVATDDVAMERFKKRMAGRK